MGQSDDLDNKLLVSEYTKNHANQGFPFGSLKTILLLLSHVAQLDCGTRNGKNYRKTILLYTYFCLTVFSIMLPDFPLF